MIRTYKRKLILTKAQEQRLRYWIGVCRLVYNIGLEIKISAWKNKQQSVHKFDLIKQLKDIREIDWIGDLPQQSLENTIIRLDNSYQKFFKGSGFPKWANKHKYKSIGFRQDENILRIENNKIKIPKMGWLKMFKDAPVIGDIKTAQIKIEPTGFFITIQCDNVPAKFESENQTIGLDMGLAAFCVDSNGNFIANPKHFKRYEDKLRIENRSLARKKKGSNRWNKQAKKLTLLHHKIGNVRKDFLHKESTKIAKANSIVCMEDLNIKGMSKNGKLAKHILDAGWGMFRTFLSYKTTVIPVNARQTSQQCSICQNIDANSRKSQSEFECTKCGHKENADINAAKNIKCKGIALSRERESLDCALALKSTNTDMSEQWKEYTKLSSIKNNLWKA